MTALIGWLVFLASLSFYSAVGMLVGTMFYRRVETGCDQYYCEHGFGAALGGAFWPVGVWLFGGILLATKPERDAVRAEQKAQAVRQLEREAGLRCRHGDYTAECHWCRTVKR